MRSQQPPRVGTTGAVGVCTYVALPTRRENDETRFNRFFYGARFLVWLASSWVKERTDASRVS